MAVAKRNNGDSKLNPFEKIPATMRGMPALIDDQQNGTIVKEAGLPLQSLIAPLYPFNTTEVRP